MREAAASVRRILCHLCQWPAAKRRMMAHAGFTGAQATRFDSLLARLVGGAVVGSRSRKGDAGFRRAARIGASGVGLVDGSKLGGRATGRGWQALMGHDSIRPIGELSAGSFGVVGMLA